MKILFVLIALFTVACGAEPQASTSAPAGISAELAPLVDQFRVDASAHGVALLDVKLDTVQLVSALPGTPPDNEVGVCYPDESGRAVYVTQPETAPENAAYNLKRLVYHELAHCLLNKGHGGVAFWSIMRATFTSMKEEPGSWERMVDELFAEDAE